MFRHFQHSRKNFVFSLNCKLPSVFFTFVWHPSLRSLLYEAPVQMIAISLRQKNSTSHKIWKTRINAKNEKCKYIVWLLGTRSSNLILEKPRCAEFMCSCAKYIYCCAEFIYYYCAVCRIYVQDLFFFLWNSWDLGFLLSIFFSFVVPTSFFELWVDSATYINAINKK